MSLSPAFEALFHPGDRNVDLRVVIKRLEDCALANKKLRHRTYRFRRPDKNNPNRCSFVAYAYSELYNARNSFMHGNAVSGRDLRFRKHSTSRSLLEIAPVIYNVALRAYMRSMFPLSEDDERDDAFAGLSDIEDALMRVRNPRIDLHGRGRRRRRQPERKRSAV